MIEEVKEWQEKWKEERRLHAKITGNMCGDHIACICVLAYHFVCR